MAKQNKRKSSSKDRNEMEQATTAFHSFLAFLRYNVIGRFISIIVIAALVLTLNTLFATNDLEKFALITGIELVVIMIVGWTIFLIKRNSKQDAKDEIEG